MTDEQIERNLVDFADSLAEGTKVSSLMISVISYIDKLKDEIAGLTVALEVLKTDNANLTRTLEECNENLQANLEKAYEHNEDECKRCTGLTDKNGKKIFEGYIVRAIGDYEIQGVVEWQKNECRYLVQLLGNNDWVTMDDYEWEIIGNIHDNPELLEEK